MKKHSHPGTITNHPIFLGALLASLVTTAQAQADAGSILQQQQRAQPQRLEQLPKPEASPPTPAVLRDTGGGKVHVRSVVFRGHQDVATDEALQALVQPLLGAPLSFGQLEQLSDTVTRHLKASGWILARAYLPEQDLSAGVLKIAIQSGRIDSPADGSGIAIDAKNELHVAHTRIQSTFAQTVLQHEAAPVHANALERAQLIVNDLPGIKSSTSLERGRTPGTTQLRVLAEQATPLSATVWVDNYGNRYTGAARASASAQWNNPLRLGDQLGAMLTQTQGVQLAQANYSLPLGYSGLRANAGGSTMRYEIGKEQAHLQSKGRAHSAFAEASYPLIRSREVNLFVAAKAEQKNLTDETGGLIVKDKQVHNRELSLSGDRYDQLAGGGITNFRLAKTLGRLDLSGEATDLASDQATAQTNGNFEKWSYSLARLQRITDALSLFVGYSGQRAQKNLDSSEKFILGGVSGVRAYASGEGSGDQGWVANLEMRYDWVEMRQLGWGDVQLVAFYDHGRTQLQRSPWLATSATASGLNSYALAGAGLGVNLSKPGQYAVRLAWAHTVGSNPGRSIPDTAAGYPDGHNSDGLSNTSRLWLTALFYF